MSSDKTPYHEAFDFLAARITTRPKVGIICGSGLGGFADTLTNVIQFNYSEIPHFPVSTVSGHKGCLVFGKVNGKDVMCMQGRFHLYEGYSADACAFPIRVMKLFGVERLVITNAAGGLNPKYKLGDFMITKDHLNIPGMCGLSPLVGKNEALWGPRFVNMHNAYDCDLRKIGHEVAADLGESKIQEGVLWSQVGPCYETVAEMKLALVAGCDALGMSTVYEVVAARHCGIKCMAVSMITNECKATYDVVQEVSHEEVIECTAQRGAAMVRFITKVIDRL